MPRKSSWWTGIVDPPTPDGQFLAAIDAELVRAQQVGVETAEVMIGFSANKRQPCPVCQRPVGRHSKRQLSRCDNSRPDIQLVG
ncbi:MAG TPA: hypothetical protein VID07_02760 [Actinomycetes bacterium]|jgi:hypothetical protein